MAPELSALKNQAGSPVFGIFCQLCLKLLHAAAAAVVY